MSKEEKDHFAEMFSTTQEQPSTKESLKKEQKVDKKITHPAKSSPSALKIKEDKKTPKPRQPKQTKQVIIAIPKIPEGFEKIDEKNLKLFNKYMDKLEAVNYALKHKDSMVSRRYALELMKGKATKRMNKILTGRELTKEIDKFVIKIKELIKN